MYFTSPLYLTSIFSCGKLDCMEEIEWHLHFVDPDQSWFKIKLFLSKVVYLFFFFQQNWNKTWFLSITLINVSFYLGGLIASNALALTFWGFSNYAYGQKYLIDFCSDLSIDVLILSLVKLPWFISLIRLRNLA